MESVKLPPGKTAASRHTDAINFTGGMNIQLSDQADVIYCAQSRSGFVAAATSASSLTALAVFRLVSECFCGEKESGINQRITNRRIGRNIHEAGWCRTHPGSGK